MRCPRCQQENPPQAKFCFECATPLALRCANCGTQLPSGAKFCFECARQIQGLSVFSMTRMGEAALAAGVLAAARAHAEAALALSREQAAGGDEAWNLYLLGAIGAGEDSASVTVSEDHYSHGLARADALGMRPVVAHCHLGLAKLYRRPDRREQAREHLTTATALYRDMGMTYWLQKAEAEMRELG